MIQRSLAAVGLLLLIVTFLPVVNWWTRALSGPWENPSGEVLIVLAGDGDAGMIGEISYWRAVYAVWTWREGGWEEIIISGGAGTANAMRDFVVAQGVPVSAVRVEGRSHSTRENALFTASMLVADGRRKVLLTSDYHIFRAVRAFRKAGVDTRTRPVPDAGKRSNTYALRWSIFVGLLAETAKICGYAVRGWL
jgi:uncharacterized SAM-binding protein YcdF (DUF218 family)